MGFQWAEKYSVKNRVIDEHHTKLFQLFDEFNNAMEAGKSEAFVKSTLMAIKEYTFYHFSFEEQLMEIAKYPEYLEHKRLHKGFIEEIDRMMINFGNADTDVTGKRIYRLLVAWLEDHILVVDQKYESYLHD